ncbi:hypothetical protein MMG85_02575 [Pseudoxanthomonas sp. LH2527]|uniref:hypothetical protein n=1 Tax=Pseudoxanthomonas sp. LH2527 TaxID=2923249 RepID=UPI001F147504|nr:hypothetical protein [Pseudoxanthomonas sp. LH2527]MCH6482456.1 hypothetical protein [Pseudoxanthomonas sp. LH2527]
MLPRILASLATLALLVACAPAHASPLVDVSVIDRDTGESLARYPHRGDLWVAGTPGHRYSVRLANTTGERVLVVLSVDGINAVTGQTADPSQAGYVLEPWQTTEISGWRKSMREVAQFVFTDLGDSYAARTGRPRHVGVIGVAAFREARTYRYPNYTPPPIARGTMEKRMEAEAAAPAASARSIVADDSARQQSIGTGHGGREWAPTSRTGFDRATRQPEQVSELRYDEHRRLVAMGILPRRHHGPIRRDDTPRAFPGGFVADPPRYR